MRILGTKYFGIDSSIFLLDTENEEIFAISTERVTRIKHDWFHIEPILKEYAIENIDFVCHSFGNFDNQDTCVETKGRFFSLLRFYGYFRRFIEPNYTLNSSIIDSKIANNIFGSRLKKAAYFISLFLKRLLPPYLELTPDKNRSSARKFIADSLEKNNISYKDIFFWDHHLCHAAPAYHFSPFAGQAPALSLTLDGQGDGHFSKLFLFDNDKYELLGASRANVFKLKGISHVSSIGEIYGNFTEVLGYVRNSGEGKVEALAAYGEADEALYTRMMDSVVISDLSMIFDVEKIEFAYDQSYLKSQLGKIGRESFAATIQKFLEDLVVEYLNAIYQSHPVGNLCLAGGVAANIIMSLNIYERTNFKNIYIFPAMADDGTSAGSAILCALKHNLDIKWLKNETMPYFGDSYEKEDAFNAIQKYTDFIEYEYLGEEWYLRAAESIAHDKIIGVFQGRMEYGPRALGNRSILANPTNPDTKIKINSTIKHRPPFQPFCPSILEEERERLFENSFIHKHMAIAFRMKEEYWERLPSAIHIDGTARPQFVEEKDNPNYYRLLKELKRLTGFGVALNTSFNLHGRTIVRKPEDAIVDFVDCRMSELYLEGFLIRRRRA